MTVPYANLLPPHILTLWEVHETNHASAVLKTDFPEEWNDILQVLSFFQLYHSEILAPGGGRSLIAIRIDDHFRRLGWREHGFATRIVVDDAELNAPTHKLDNLKNRVGCDLEWNNKTEFYDRDMSNMRLLFELRALSVGVIITRSSELQTLFASLGKGSSYGQSTTHMNKLVRRLTGGTGGGCPILAFGIRTVNTIDDITNPALYVDRVHPSVNHPHSVSTLARFETLGITAPA